VDRLLGGRLKIIVAAGSTRGLDASKVGEAGLLGETGLRGFQGIEELYSVAEGVLGVRRGWAGGRGGAGIHPVVGAALEVQPLTPPGAAGDGVLSVRAPFLKDPLVTGDVASLSDAGVVELQGRASDAGVLAGGGRVSPARAEDALLAQPWVSQAAVVSEGRPFPVVLVVPVFEQLKKAECARLGSERLQSEAQLVAPGCPARSEVDRQVAAALAVLATHPQVAAHEVPRAAAILPERFQVSASRVSNMPCTIRRGPAPLTLTARGPRRIEAGSRCRCSMVQ
jgi:acyl-CoA synthetase (AMP-forming)/AMP-acid ligase II